MTRTGLICGIFAVVLVLASMFAPAPVSRSVLAQGRQHSGSGSGPIPESPACEGLRNAYEACNSHGNADCSHVREQLFAHGCRVPSGSSR